MKTGFAQKQTSIQREAGTTCPQRKGRKIVPGMEGVCEHDFVTELCILRGCKNIGVRRLEERHTGDHGEQPAVKAQGVTLEERASLAER